ncbi:MAG: peptide chain release factor N(5)-glutamine methyltransferase [Puniceicoccales bacterium]|jgi:release factor glutamine methyltransferase|nr:peptide chain release factor N(5)-glutamine methyltransferase [Puniceicoccales bacterium]
MRSILELLTRGSAFLRSKNIERPKCDAEWLFAHVLGCSRLELYLKYQMTVDPQAEARLRVLFVRRAKREPLQYILGQVDFCGVKLFVDVRVLIPRHETEMLVEWLIDNINQCYKKIGCKDHEKMNHSPLSILDLGTGSGAIAIALGKYFPESQVYAVDKSPLALAVARENKQRNGVNNVHILESDWYSAFGEERWSNKFDVIVANPPYLTRQEFDAAQEEVRKYEPISALVADDEGLSDIEIILSSAPKFLKTNGIIAIETGILHSQKLQERYGKYFRRTEIMQDLNKFDRFFIAYR